MKKQIVSTLCSAFIIPGLGQVLNYHVKKGLILLGAVFILFIAGTVKLALLITSIVSPHVVTDLNTTVVMNNLKNEDPRMIYFLVITFGCLWLYSIVDAFWYGRKIDTATKDDIK